MLSKSEQVGHDMIDIMTHIHTYVPQKDDGQFIPIFFGGDQLTRERASGAQDARLQASDALGRLAGVIPKTEDWHALVCFYQVSIACTHCIVALIPINERIYISIGHMESPVQHKLIL